MDGCMVEWVVCEWMGNVGGADGCMLRERIYEWMDSTAKACHVKKKSISSSVPHIKVVLYYASPFEIFDLRCLFLKTEVFPYATSSCRTFYSMLCYFFF